MINVTNGNLYNAFPVLKKLAEKEMPVKVSFRLAKLLNEISGDVRTIETERYKIGERYGTLNESRTEFIILEENAEAFKNAVTELSEIEISVNADKIPLSEEITVSASDLMLIESFIDYNGGD